MIRFFAVMALACAGGETLAILYIAAPGDLTQMFHKGMLLGLIGIGFAILAPRP